MTDEELIARLRDFATREASAMPPGWPDAHGLYSDAADRLETLVKERDALTRRNEHWRRESDRAIHGLTTRAEAAEAELLAVRQAVQHANDHADAAIKDLKALEQKLEQETRRRQSMTDTAFDWKARADLATPAAMPPEMRKAVHELEQLANRLSCGTAASRGTADSIMEIIAALRAGGEA